jgi:hypothetical protein
MSSTKWAHIRSARWWAACTAIVAMECMLFAACAVLTLTTPRGLVWWQRVGIVSGAALGGAVFWCICARTSRVLEHASVAGLKQHQEEEEGWEKQDQRKIDAVV